MASSGFWWIMLAVGIYGGLHSFLASHQAKGWAERHFGDRARRFYRLFFVLSSLVTAPPLLLLPLILPDRQIYRIPMPWLLLTLALQGLGLLGLAAAVSQTGAAAFLGLQQIVHPAPLRSRSSPEQLVTSGLYRYVRHPIYSATLLLIWLMPIMTWNMLALLLGITVYTFIGTLFEERKLHEEFGEAYEAYRRTTPMVIPRIVRR